MINSEIEMNKLAKEFMGKFELGGMSAEEFFGDDVDTINKIVIVKGWYKFESHYGLADVEFVGKEIDEVLLRELREQEKVFLSDGSDDYEYDIREDFIDIEDVCYVRVDGMVGYIDPELLELEEV